MSRRARQTRALYREVAQRVREHRKSQGLSVDALAKASRLTRKQIIYVEAGRGAPVVNLQWIANALGVELRELVP